MDQCLAFHIVDYLEPTLRTEDVFYSSYYTYMLLNLYTFLQTLLLRTLLGFQPPSADLASRIPSSLEGETARSCSTLLIYAHLCLLLCSISLSQRLVYHPPR